MWVWSLGREDPLEKEMATHPVFLPGQFCGQRSLAGYGPRGRKESGMNEWLNVRMHTRTHTHSFLTLWSSFGEQSSSCGVLGQALSIMLISGCLAGLLTRCSFSLHTLLPVCEWVDSSACWSAGYLGFGEAGRLSYSPPAVTEWTVVGLLTGP